jgi:hypothetical protein
LRRVGEAKPSLTRSRVRGAAAAEPERITLQFSLPYLHCRSREERRSHDKDGLGVWEHRGKIAVAGVGHSPVDRRWDEVSMDKTLGAYSILACRRPWTRQV